MEYGILLFEFKGGEDDNSEITSANNITLYREQSDELVGHFKSNYNQNNRTV